MFILENPRQQLAYRSVSSVPGLGPYGQARVYPGVGENNESNCGKERGDVFPQGCKRVSGIYLGPGLYPEEFLRPTVEFILNVQQDSGEIPWFESGYTDPWDHIEAAMGLSIGGEYAAAKRAYEWLAGVQLDDGSWWASYRGDEIDNSKRRETNFIAYIATGVWHHYLITQDREFLQALIQTAI